MFSLSSSLRVFLVMVFLWVESSGAAESACTMSGDDSVYCNCDVEDAAQAEVVKCSAWNTTQDPEHLWGIISQLKGMSYWEIIQRQERPFQLFPPPQLFNSLKKLNYFMMKSSKIDKIPAHAFGNSSSISEVTLQDDVIGILEENSFGNMRNVSKITLSSNVLTQVNRNVFVKLPKLQNLYLDRNMIEVVHDGAFRDLSNLLELDLQHNNISTITREVFLGLKKLSRLELQVNVIEYLGEGVFAEMPNLQELDLHGNQIMSISPKAFLGLSKLARLNLQANKIVLLEPKTFLGMDMMYMLDLRDNALESLSSELVEPIYANLKNMSMQLLLTGNRFKCDCRILWMPKIYEETESLHLKRSLEKLSCDNFQEDKPQRHVSFKGNNATVEETTSYAAFEGVKNVIQLSPKDFKCHHQHHPSSSNSLPQQDGGVVKGSDDPKSHTPHVSENKKHVQVQSQHQSHVDVTNDSSSSSSIFYLILLLVVTFF